MWLCHGWGWQPPQSASHIHIRHVQSVYAHWYAVHMHKISALHSYTHPTSLHRFWGSGSLVESKWCDCVMVEADSHFKLLPTSILDIYKVFEHIDMLSMGIQYQPYTVIPTLLGLDLGVLGHLWMLEKFARTVSDPQICPCLHVSVDRAHPSKLVFGSNAFLVVRCFYLSLAKIVCVKTGEIASSQDLSLDPLQPQLAVCPAKIWSILRTYHNYINPNTLLWHNGHETIVPKP